MGYEFRAHVFVRKCRVSGTRARTDKASFLTTIEKLRAHRSARVGASRVQIRTVHDDEAPPRACTKRGASDLVAHPSGCEGLLLVWSGGVRPVVLAPLALCGHSVGN